MVTRKLQTMSNEAIVVAGLKLLAEWAKAAEEWWYPIPGRSGLGCYGTGYGGWGVQTNQKFLAGMATLGGLGPAYGFDPGLCERAMDRAMAAWRFSLDSHLTGEGCCTDGTRWGQTWISALGIERMMYALPYLDPHLTAQDRDDLRRLLTSECSAILHGAETFRRPAGVVGDVWGHSGRNVPESNLWNGAAAWRTAAMFPDLPEAEALRELARQLLINSISIPADATDERLVDGRPVRNRFRGANFFPHFALDHHSYMNVGYQVICLSNMALLHFDLRAAGLPAPEALYHHGADLWRVVRRMVFRDGRLARIGGDSRVRYAYCQEYLLPALTLAADRFGERYARLLVTNQLKWTVAEQEYNGDGSFYGRRLAHLRGISPYYITRLESDRAAALGMLATHLHQCPGLFDGQSDDAAACELSAQGAWSEPEHGDVLHRCPTRLASFAWRAEGLAQGLCLTPADGHLAEWSCNLGGRVRFAGEQVQARRLDGYHIDVFEGGFITSGMWTEGVKVRLAEGWEGTDLAASQLALAALPDGHTVLGLQFCRAGARRVAVVEAKSMHLNIPNDLFNGFQRQMTTAHGSLTLSAPAPEHARVEKLDSLWACIEGRLGAVGIYGADSLALARSRDRRGGHLHSLYVEELCWSAFEGPARMVDAGSVILDAGWAVLSAADAAGTARFADRAAAWHAPAPARGVQVMGMDGRTYLILANFGDAEIALELPGVWQDLVRATRVDGSVRLPAGRAALFCRPSGNSS